MMRWLWPLAFVLAAGCASEAKYREAVSHWVGQPEEALVQAWGAPDQFYENKDGRFLTYDYRDSRLVGGTPATYTTEVVGNRAYTTAWPGSDPTLVTLRCKTTFRIQEGVVADWRYEGNACAL